MAKRKGLASGALEIAAAAKAGEEGGELITTALVIGADMHKILQAVAFKRSRSEGGRPSASKVVRGILESHRKELEKEAGKYLAMWD